MNILPLILALVLMLSVLTIEKLEKFKNTTIVQEKYQQFLKMHERQVFNKRQKRLYGYSDKNLRQLSFRFFIDKEARERDASVAKQYRMLMIELMKIVYGEAAFYKNLEQERPHFLEELLTAVEQATEKAPKKMIRRVQDISRLNLEDTKLQEAFYHMLKGTVSREELAEMNEEMKEGKQQRDFSMKEKAYVSLFNFINDEGKKASPKIVIQRAPREILKAIFLKDEVVEAVIAKRNELAANKTDGSEAAFKSEFIGECRQGLDDKLLDFSISAGDKSGYN